jgi:hypothetical protein
MSHREAFALLVLVLTVGTAVICHRSQGQDCCQVTRQVSR